MYFNWARGMIGFDKEIVVFVCVVEVNDFLKTFKTDTCKQNCTRSSLTFAGEGLRFRLRVIRLSGRSRV